MPIGSVLTGRQSRMTDREKLIDREKVITGLEMCATNPDPDCREKCPYYSAHAPCVEAMCKDALELLKEQKAIKPKIDAFGHPYCPKCKVLVYQTWSFCPHCGQELIWE